MATSEERLRILQLLQEGKITPQEASALLDALDAPRRPAAAPSSRKARWLHIRVTDLKTGKPRVNVTLPVAMVRAALKLGSRLSTELEGLDPALLETCLAQGELCTLVDMIDEASGEQVQVYMD